MSFEKKVLDILREANVDFKIVQGSRHMKIFVGTKMCGIYPRGDTECGTRAAKNVIAQVRRAIKREKEKKVERV